MLTSSRALALCALVTLATPAMAADPRGAEIALQEARLSLGQCITSTAEKYATQSCETPDAIYEATFGACSGDVDKLKQASYVLLSAVPKDKQNLLINEALQYYKPFAFNTVIASRIKARKECR